jgi:hypothetical protein
MRSLRPRVLLGDVNADLSAVLIVENTVIA